MPLNWQLGRLHKLSRIFQRVGQPMVLRRSKDEPLVVMRLSDYAELLSYKRQAKSWADLNEHEKAAIKEASETYKDI